MNKHGLKNNLVKANEMIHSLEKKKLSELDKNPRDYNKIKRIEYKIEQIKKGMENIRNKIRKIR